MKTRHFILMLFACLLCTLNSCSRAYGGWLSKDHADQENREKIVQVESLLNHQRQATGGWQAAALVLAIGCVTLFTLGTAIGSKIRRRFHARSASL